MKKNNLLLSCRVIPFLILSMWHNNHLLAQNAIVGAGFSSGWGGSCGSSSNFTYFSASAGTSYGSAALTPAGTGNQYWRMAIDWSGTIKQLNTNGGAPDVNASPNTTYTLNNTCTTNGALYYNVGSSSYRYIFKTLDAGSNPSNKFVFFEIQGSPITVSGVSQSPTNGSVTPSLTVTVTATLSASLPTGQGVYLRYTTNNFSTTTVTTMAGSGTSYTATIPANSVGTTVKYYVFTSGTANVATDGSNSDFYTINLNNNSGSNYSYSVTAASAALTTDSTSLTYLSQNVGTQSSAHSFKLSGTNLTGSPGNLTVNAPSTDFQVSNDNSTWGSSATIAYSSATLSSTSVYVRFSPQSVGAKSGNITFSGGGVGSPPTIAVSGTGTLAAPTSPTATPVSQTSFTASWTSVSGAASYQLDVATSSSFGGTILSGYNNLFVSGTSQSVTVSGPGTYYFQVRAYASGTTSSNSTTQSITINDINSADYRSQVTGAYTTAATWQYDVTGAGNYITATQAPGANNNTTIQFGHIVTMTGNTTINTGKTITVAGTLNDSTFVISGAGNFAVSAGGYFITKHASGINATGTNTGAIQVTGSRTYSSLASYGYSATGAANTGNFFSATTPTANTVLNLGVGNNLGGGTFTYNGSNTTNVTSTLLLYSGSLVATGDTINIGNGGSVTCTGGTMATTGTDGADGGTINFLSGSSASGISYPTGSTATFYNIFINGINAAGYYLGGSSTTLNGTLRINGSYVQSGTAPTYASTSTLNYNGGTTYGVSNEWSSGTTGAGIPQNVSLTTTGTSLNFGANTSGTSYRYLKGNLSIGAGTTFTLGTTTGDLKLDGNWTRASTGTFVPSCRAVFFTGSGTQTVQVTGGGTETFNYLVLGHSGTLRPNNTTGNVTHIRAYNPTASNPCAGGALVQWTGTGVLDLNGDTFKVDNSTTVAGSGSPASYIYVTGARTVTNSSGISVGAFSLMSTDYPNVPTNGTLGVHNNVGTGSLKFDSSVVVTIGDGYCDFGLSGTPITTINGVLQINLGGSVGSNAGNNPCNYGTNSTLRFANTVDYQVNSGDKTWASGSTYSGNAGIPYNVQVSDAGTDLTLNSARALRGNLTITNGTLTLNTATFSLGGNWSRSGISSAFTPNTNKVLFNGTGPQTITCTANSNTETYYDLEAGGSSTLTYNGSTIVKVTHVTTLSGGNVNTGGNTMYISNNASGALTGYSSSRYIIGTLKRDVTAGGNYDFPIGTSTNYELANITFSAGMTGTTNLTASFSSTISGTMPSRYTTWINKTSIDSILNGGIWTITPDAQPTAGTYDVTLSQRGYSNPPSPYKTDTSANRMGIIKRANSSSNWFGCGGDHNGNAQTDPEAAGTHTYGNQSLSGGVASVFRSGATTFSDFGVGIGQGGFALPVKLISFTAENYNHSALLKWTTASELNNDHFTIERSIDGSHFTAIGTVKGHGNSTQEINYNYTDEELSHLNVSVVYYRLKQVDIDGTTDYSDMVALNVDFGTAGFHINSINHNPFKDNFSISFFSPTTEAVQLTLYTLTGQVAKTMDITPSVGNNQMTIGDMDVLAAGFYTLHISKGTERFTFKVLKEQ